MWVCLCALLLSPLVAFGQRCAQRAVLQAAADVYRLPPKFVTGVGWQGDRIDVLAAGTQVLRCATSDVPVGFSSATWAQVAYKRGADWKYGWILQESLKLVSGRSKTWRDDLAAVGAILLMAGDASAEEKIQWTLEGTAPPPPPLEENGKQVLPPPVNTVTLGGQLKAYWPLFFAMVLGMVAKALVDLVEETSRSLMLRHVRRGVVAILVSPIVFLGFLNSGQFDGSAQTFLVLLMLSFQNGFFWQTILKTDVKTGGKGSQPAQG